MPPTYVPAPPHPAIDRPKIRTSILGAAPQRAEPISKRVTAMMKSHLLSKVPNRDALQNHKYKAGEPIYKLITRLEL